MEEKISDMLGEPSVEENAAPIPEAVQTADVQPPEGETQEQAAQRERDELGRFKAKEAAEAQQPDPAAKIKNTPEQDAAFAAMRRELDELKRGQQQPPRAPETPQEQELDHHLNASEERTTALLSLQMGDPDRAQAIVDQAKAYFQQLPPEQQQKIIFSQEPYAALLIQYQRAYAEHQRQQSAQAYLARLQELEFPTDDPAKIDEWAINRARRLAAEKQGEAQSQQSAKPLPSSSILSMPAAGRGHDGNVPVGGDMMAEVFGR